MEEPSSPISPHLLSKHVASSAAYPNAPDVCLLPHAHAPLPPRVSASVYKSASLPQPRTSGGRGFIASSLQQHQGNGASLKENKDDCNDQNQTSKDKPLLQVDCHLFPPASTWSNSQPITPSPRALHDNSSYGGWKVPTSNGSLEKISGNSNDLGAEERRIGYDGTTQTPSLQLLKPTASSLGQRVSKPPLCPQPTFSPPRSLHSSPYSLDSPLNQNYAPSGNDQTGHASQMRSMFNTPDSFPPITDPFEKLNQSNYTTSDDDTEMDEKTQNSTSLLEEFDVFDEPTGFSSYISKTPRPQNTSFQRCSSWSPGDGFRGMNALGKSCPERRRTCNIDPVASQLLKACAAHEEEQEEETENEDQLSMSESGIGRYLQSRGCVVKGGLYNISCHSPIPPPNNGNCNNNGRSLSLSSLPDIANSTPSTSTRQGSMGRGSKVSPMITEEAPLNFPLSPRVPLFGDLSNSLREGEGEDMKSLARPVPRKFGSMPTLFCGSPRRSSLPRNL